MQHPMCSLNFIEDCDFTEVGNSKVQLFYYCAYICTLVLVLSILLTFTQTSFILLTTYSNTAHYISDYKGSGR